MAYALQYRRGTTTQHNSFTGLLGEVTVDTDKKTLVVHDGSTRGGFPLAREGSASTASTGTFTSNVTVGGTFSVTSTASFSDDVTITGDLGMTGHIIPSVDSDGTTGYDLGSPDMKWRDLYLSQGSLYIDGQKVIESNSGTIVVQADPDQSLTTKVSGSGVMTLESATTVNMAATLQMSSGKKITDQAGNAVVFGDKVDMDNNQLINLGVPTASEHATTKGYVDALVNSISGSAITEGDSEIEIADLGTGTIGFTVDGSQRLALSATTASFTVPVTVSGATLATEAYVDSEISTLSAAVASGTYGDADVKSYLEAYDGDINLDALKSITYTDFSGTAQQFIRITEAGGNANGAVIGATYFTTIDPGLDLRFATSNHRNAKFDLNNGHLSLENSQIKNVGTPTDSADAATKAYVDSSVAGLVDSAPGALDTLNELAAALGDDANFASATTAALATKATTAYVDSEISTLSASVASGAYGDADVADYLTSGSVTSFEIRETSVDLAQATLTSTLTNPNSGGGTARDGFAYAIDSNDTHVIVGAYNEVGTSINSGVAYVYNLSDMSLAHTLINPDNSSPSSYDRFGYNLVMSNSYAMIGAPQDETSSTRKGTVYIYDTSDFSLKHSIPVPDVSNNPSFGGTYNDSFAIDDTHAVVGHGNYDTIYVIDLETGQIDGTITSSSYQSNFGRSVAMSSAYIAVADATNNSQVHVYNRSDLSHAYSISSPISAGDALGEGLMMTETYIIASAKRADVNGVTNVGAVHVFNIADGSLAYTIHNPNPATTQFSEIFAIDGSHLLVGDESSGDGGRAYIFDLANNGSLIKTFDNPNDFAGAASNDYFGRALALKGETVVIGAYEEDDATSNDTGRVYVFKAPAAQSLFDIDSATSTLQIGADMTVGNTATFNSNVTISSTPTEPTHATNKAYVDSAVAGLVDSAPEALDTLNELAAALGDDANFSSTVVNNIATAKSEAIATASADATAKADQAEADAIASAEAKDAVRATAANAYADQAEADAIATASADATAKANAALASAQSYADTAEADAIASAEAKDVVRAAAAEAYADQAEADAIASAEAKDVARALTASNDRAAIRSEFAAADTTLQSNIDTEKGRIDAIMSASTSDADTFAEIVSLVNSVDTTNDNGLAAEITARTNADTALSGRLDTVEGTGTGSVAKALVDAKAYADQAEADAIASAEAKDVVRAAAANAYADQAEVDAKAYTDTRETAITTAYEAYADQAEADAIATAAADATTKANAAQAVADSALPKTGGTMTGTVVVKGVNETVKVITGASPAILPSDGTIQTWTLSGASTPTFSGSWASGEAITLMVSAGASGSVTWPTMQWAGGTAPTLSTSGYTVMTLWKVGTTFYGTSSGDMS